MSGALPWLDAATLRRLVPMNTAVHTIETALRAGVDPTADPARGVLDLRCGSLLLMPTEVGNRVGVKLASVAPDNPRRGLPRISAVYVLFDGDTLTPVALLDGTALTTLRTPAVSAVAVSHLAPARASRLVLFGTGPQAVGHVEAIRTVAPLREVVVVGRDPARAAAFASHVGGGLTARAGDAGAVAGADIVVCATTARQPLFSGAAVPDAACVVAVGSHEPDCRELDSALLGRSYVVVEDAATALREAGDVVLALIAGALAAGDLVSLADVVTGRVTLPADRPRVFKSVGMAWEDLVVAAEAYRRHQAGD